MEQLYHGCYSTLGMINIINLLLCPENAYNYNPSFILSEYITPIVIFICKLHAHKNDSKSADAAADSKRNTINRNQTS
jgi:hypothetical protein